ncbi:uncharacterized protein LOC130263057 isoform X1 [Oenanthe melanoleuca]|uniref:uncharacterized protein LOC130263057 isoform X1 n=1 Tax=Oenanthe melanoleuca TaxID=2939378 RepID=UPI0024C1C87C|nr:uncharacterized protein LOC130263057 isoform X1 [Oenanthe melanoleuca]
MLGGFSRTFLGFPVSDPSILHLLLMPFPCWVVFPENSMDVHGQIHPSSSRLLMPFPCWTVFPEHSMNFHGQIHPSSIASWCLFHAGGFSKTFHGFFVVRSIHLPSSPGCFSRTLHGFFVVRSIHLPSFLDAFSMLDVFSRTFHGFPWSGSTTHGSFPDGFFLAMQFFQNFPWILNIRPIHPPSPLDAFSNPSDFSRTFHGFFVVRSIHPPLFLDAFSMLDSFSRTFHGFFVVRSVHPPSPLGAFSKLDHFSRTFHGFPWTDPSILHLLVVFPERSVDFQAPSSIPLLSSLDVLGAGHPLVASPPTVTSWCHLLVSPNVLQCPLMSPGGHLHPPHVPGDPEATIPVPSVP